MTLSWRSLRASPADGPEFGTVEGDGNTRLPGFVPAETAGTGKEIDAVRGAPKSVIEPEESSAFLIYFKPQGVGLREVTLRIFSNDPNHNPFVVYLQGTGLVPEPEIALENGSSADLTSGVSTEQFGDVALGSSRDLSFTIHNPGSAGLSVSDISLWGGTRLRLPDCIRRSGRDQQRRILKLQRKVFFPRHGNPHGDAPDPQQRWE